MTYASGFRAGIEAAAKVAADKANVSLAIRDAARATGDCDGAAIFGGLAEKAHEIAAAIRATPAPADDGWQPIETAPRDGEFFVEDQYGDICRVQLYPRPSGRPAEALVIQPRTGRMWGAKRWRPLPAPPARGGEG